MNEIKRKLWLFFAKPLLSKIKKKKLPQKILYYGSLSNGSLK